MGRLSDICRTEWTRTRGCYQDVPDSLTGVGNGSTLENFSMSTSSQHNPINAPHKALKEGAQYQVVEREEHGWDGNQPSGAGKSEFWNPTGVAPTPQYEWPLAEVLYRVLDLPQCSTMVWSEYLVSFDNSVWNALASATEKYRPPTISKYVSNKFV